MIETRGNHQPATVRAGEQDVCVADLQASELAALDQVIATLDAIRSAAVGDSGFGFTDPMPVFLRKMRLLTPQSYGARVQNRLAREFGWTIVSSRVNRGDCVDAAGDHWEIKVTFVTASNPAANFVQIRPHQDVAGYQLFVIDEQYRIHHLRLSKDQMEDELILTGTTAHGTPSANLTNSNLEYALRVPWTPQSGTAARWLADYGQPTPAFA